MSPQIYSNIIEGAPPKLRQGQIFSDLVQAYIDVGTIGSEDWEINEKTHPYAVLLTQDCDLEQDYATRTAAAAVSDDKKLPNLLFCEATTAELLLSAIQGKDIKKRIIQNKDERYHFLQKIEESNDAQDTGLPELGIDFKRLFTIPTDEIYKRVEIGEAKIRCVLNSPYLEHLSSRFSYFMSRVALPIDHISE